MKLPIISEDAGAKIACGRGTGNNFIISDGLNCNTAERLTIQSVNNTLMCVIVYVTAKQAALIGSVLHPMIVLCWKVTEMQCTFNSTTALMYIYK